MNTVDKIIIVVCLMVLSCFAGVLLDRHFAAPAQTTEKVKEQEVVHAVTTTVTTKQPDGAIKTVTTVDSHTDSKTTKDIKIKPNGHKTNISLLMSYDFTKPVGERPAYGLSLSGEVLGPVTLGVWGLNNGTAGVSLGVNF